jgi:hypothetical protein
VHKAFQENGFAFLLKVFNELNYLEDLTGLLAMQLATDLDGVKFKLNERKNSLCFVLDNRIE